MTARRGHFSKGVINTLKMRSGGLCSICHRQTIGPSNTAPNKSETIGIAAHIKGAQPGSARYDADQTEEERHSIENGIWLCAGCATLIDNNQGIDYPVNALIQQKRIAEKAARERYVQGAKSVKENCIGTLIYINVPRLIHYEALTGQAGGFPTDFLHGIPDRFIVPELVAMERALESLEFPALDWKDAVATVPEPEGLLVSFEGIFRTKNGPKSRQLDCGVDLTNLQTAPHIYRSDAGSKLILPYDPQYLTTNTALAEFSSGQVRVGGFALIKRKVETEIWATPLLIGLWTSPEARALMDALRSPNPPRTRTL